MPFACQRRVSRFGITVLLSLVFLTGVCLGSIGDGPSLLVNESDYAELRARASTQPWATMKSQAIAASNNGYGDVSGSSYYNVQICLESTALAYILDVPNQATYKTRIYDGIATELGKLNIGDAHDWTGVVRGGTIVFSAINALDLIYPYLTTAQQTTCVNAIQNEVNSITRSGYGYYWPLARQGLHGTWDIFRGVSYNPDTYYNEVMADLTPGGVFKSGCTYAYSRHNFLDRNVKTLFMDVLEHTGVDNRYYDNPRIQAFQEWLFTATASPSKKIITFGDSIPSDTFVSYSPLYRAAKFGDTVAGYASNLAYFDYPSRRDLFSYVIPDADELFFVDGKTMPAPAPVKPRSKIYADGGAWFWEDNSTEKSLMGAVWAVTGIGYIDAHAHKESNAIYMAAYGEHVLLNSGYAGYGAGWGSYSWSWFNNNARSANTVLINNADHSSKNGGGVEEGFASHGFDYACSNDGPALSNDTHLRSFIFVKPQDEKSGYFLLFDEVDADAGETVNVLLHPNTKATTGITTVSDKREYQATIDGLILDGNDDVKLTVFYGTAPTSVTKENGGIAHAGHGDGGFEAKYLNAKYNTDASGNVQVATVLFPHNDTHVKAAMTRLSGAGYNGASVDHGDSVVDYVLASDGTTNVTCEGTTFKAKSAVFRKLGSELGFYFVRDGLEFRDGDVGFEATSDISIHVDELVGMIRSDGTEVKFLCPYLQEVLLNGVAITPTAYGDGWVSGYVDPGTHELELVVPEPATLSLLTIGGLALLRRKRK